MTNTNLSNRQIQNTNQIDYNHLRNLTEAEELIIEIAESREISPSDQDLQDHTQDLPELPPRLPHPRNHPKQSKNSKS